MPFDISGIDSLMSPLTAEEKISRAKYDARTATPFFAYMLEFLKLIFSELVKTAGITAKSKCLINRLYVDSLMDDQVLGLLVHEVMHPASHHFRRGQGRELTCNGVSIFNVACDALINQMIIANGIALPPGGVETVNDELKFGHIIVKNVSQKSAEELYDEIVAQLVREQGEPESSNSDGSGPGDFSSPEEVPQGFDEHLDDDSDEATGGGNSSDEGETPQGSGQSDEESEMPEVDWTTVLSEAYTYAKLIGKEPAGFDKLFDQLHKPKVNWRALLRQTVANSIPEDMTWSRPNKKYIASGIYMPSPYGESMKVICAIDTSGSISHEDLTDFISEITGIARTYHEVEFVILTHDIDVHDEIVVCDANQDRLQSLELHGGGGTSHIPLFDYIEDNRKKWSMEATIVVSFTDGYSDFPTTRPRADQIVFVLSGGHCPLDSMPTWANAVLSIA